MCNNTKDQHIVPRMLLKHFVSDVDDISIFSKKGRLSCFDSDLTSIRLEHIKIKRDDLFLEWEETVKYMSPKEVMKKVNIYEVDGLPINTIENRYYEVENKISPILDNFLNNIDLSKNKISITDIDLELFIRFMYIQSVRSEYVIEGYNFLEKRFSSLVGKDFKKKMLLEHSDLYSKMVNSFYDRYSKSHSFICYKPPKDYHFIIGETATMWLNNNNDLYMPVSPICCFALINDSCVHNCVIEEMSEDTYFCLLSGFVKHSRYLISDKFSKTLLCNMSMDRLLQTSKEKILYTKPL